MTYRKTWEKRLLYSEKYKKMGKKGTRQIDKKMELCYNKSV